MPNNVAAVQLAIDDCCRLIVLVQQVIANPTQANIDTVVNAAEGSQTLVPRPSYSIDGQSFQWESYRTALIKSVTDLQILLTVLGGPFELRSRART